MKADVKGSIPRNTHFPFILSYFSKKTSNSDMFGAACDKVFLRTLFIRAHMYILFAIEIEPLLWPCLDPPS